MYPRVLPSVADDQVHILVGRRVVTVPLPPRFKRGDQRNLARLRAVAEALHRLKVRR